MQSDQKQANKTIILTAGGTGGHMFPAVALAEKLRDKGAHVVLVTDERAQKYETRRDIFTLEILKVRSPVGSIIKKLKSALSMACSYFKARRIIRKYKPDVVIGFGGYPSFPTMLAAQHMGIHNIIHEQNAVIGKANLMMAKKVHDIAISLPKIIGLSAQEEKKIVFTGNPVRQEIQDLYQQDYQASLCGEDDFIVFVLGGSQGASVFSDVLPQAFDKLSSADKARLKIMQQCRPVDVDRTIAAYKDIGVSCEAAHFFHDVPARLKQAHLVIARSGASTVCEVVTAGKPAIFVPYPWHKDQQQKMNADVIADKGGAWVMAQDGFTPDALLTRIQTFLQDPNILQKAAANAKSCAMPNAAEKLADLVMAS